MWLMRQAGRYMSAFRACVPLRRRLLRSTRDATPHTHSHSYSDKYPFRMRSETPEIALELSLQARGTRAVASAAVATS